MNPHLSEETLVLWYYGECEDPATVSSHLDQCAVCRDHLTRLRAQLDECNQWRVPTPDAGLADRVWARVQPTLPTVKAPRRVIPLSRPTWSSFAIAAALLVAFGLGWFWPRSAQSVPSGQPILQQSVLQHLEKSQRFLVEQRNRHQDGQAQPISDRQADTLLRETRFYRAVTVNHAEPSLGHLLEELERLLTEIANAEGAALESQWEHGDGDMELLFKIKVVGNKLRAQTQPAQPAQPQL